MKSWSSGTDSGETGSPVQNKIDFFVVHSDDVARVWKLGENVFGWRFQSWGPPDPSFDLDGCTGRSRDRRRLRLLDGSNLLHLLERHGHCVRIDIAEAKKIAAFRENQM
jgi:hypothetical protein